MENITFDVSKLINTCVSWLRKPSSILILLTAIWAVAVAIRFSLCLSTSENPSIMPDEALYLHLSRSIFNGEGLLLRGQPVRYEYILYPLLISPLHLLPDGINFFRAVQFVNCLMMCSAVFPAYLIGLKITDSKKRAFSIALITLVLPDFVMINHAMVESLIIPLVLWTFYSFIVLIEKDTYSAKLTILNILLCFLLYMAKPGLIAVFIAEALIFIWLLIKERSRVRLMQAGTAVVLSLILLVTYELILRLVFQIDSVQTTLYGQQTAPLDLYHIKQTLSGLLVYSVYLPVAFLVFPLILPFSVRKNFGHKKRIPLYMILISLILAAVIVVYIIYSDEMGANPYATRIHIRYFAAFFPVFLAYTLSPEMQHTKLRLSVVIVCVVVIAGMFLLSGTGIMSSRFKPVDALMLSWMLHDDPLLYGRLWAALIVTVFVAAMIWRISMRGFGKGEQIVLGILIVTVFLVNTPIGYDLNRHNMDPAYTADAAQARADAGEDVLMVAVDGGFFWPDTSALDNVYRYSIPVVELADLVSNTSTGGTLKDFLPRDYWQTLGTNVISVPETLILSSEIMNRIVLRENLAITTTENGLYTLVGMPDDGVWLHSALVGFNENWVTTESRFYLFNQPTLATGLIRVYFEVRAGSGNTVLNLIHGTQAYSYPLENQLTWIYIDVVITDPINPLLIGFSLTDSTNVYVNSYYVVPEDSLSLEQMD